MPVAFGGCHLDSPLTRSVERGPLRHQVRRSSSWFALLTGLDSARISVRLRRGAWGLECLRSVCTSPAAGPRSALRNCHVGNRLHPGRGSRSPPCWRRQTKIGSIIDEVDWQLCTRLETLLPTPHRYLPHVWSKALVRGRQLCDFSHLMTTSVHRLESVSLSNLQHFSPKSVAVLRC